MCINRSKYETYNVHAKGLDEKLLLNYSLTFDYDVNQHLLYRLIDAKDIII